MADGDVVDEVRVGVIAGSGMADALAGEGGESFEVETPFGRPSSAITKTRWEGTEVCVLQRHGPGHALGPSAVPYRANVFALKSLGVTHVLASAAVGSLREDVHPGELMIVDQLIDRTLGRDRTFYERTAVHAEFGEPFCPVMRRWLIEASERLAKGEEPGHRRVHDRGTMVVMEGPSFSTRAESRMYRQWGGDVIGMTGLPEARLAREAEMAYATLAMPTDYDSWKPVEGTAASGSGQADSLLEEIRGNLQVAVAASLSLIREALRHTGRLRREPSPAHRALDQGIWTSRDAIDPAEVERLRPLWGRHFG